MTESAFTVTVYDGTVNHAVLDEATGIYCEVYAEPPYLEGEVDFYEFAESLPRRAAQENFRLVIVRLGRESLGFAMGHRLPTNTNWWTGANTPISPELTAEYPGRTFAVIEIAVRASYRRRGLGRRLHAHLTTDLTEARQTLLVRPDAEPARTAYSHWGYQKVGQVRPFEQAPIYDAMIAGGG